MPVSPNPTILSKYASISSIALGREVTITTDLCSVLRFIKLVT